MALGAIRRSRKKVRRSAARGGPRERDFRIRVHVYRMTERKRDVTGMRGNYVAQACVGPSRYSARRCGNERAGMTPTAATKAALHALARRLK